MNKTTHTYNIMDFAKLVIDTLNVPIAVSMPMPSAPPLDIQLGKPIYIPEPSAPPLISQHQASPLCPRVPPSSSSRLQPTVSPATAAAVMLAHPEFFEKVANLSEEVLFLQERDEDQEGEIEDGFGAAN